MDTHPLTLIRSGSSPASATTTNGHRLASVKPLPASGVGEGNPAPAQLRIMIDTIPALACSCFPDGAAEFLNDRWLKYTGLSQEEATGWGWRGRFIMPIWKS